MFSSITFLCSLRTPFVALLTYATAVATAPAASATPSLTVKTSVSNVNVDKLEDLKVIATIANTGGETLRLLNDPHGVLNPFPGDSFTITDPSGSRPPFSGAEVNYSPTHVAGLADPSEFTVLAPGDSIDVTHDLSAAYDFSRSCAGDYSIEPSRRFTYVDADGTPRDLYATIEDIAKVKLSGNLATPWHVHEKRTVWLGCSSKEKAMIRAAYTKAKEYATEAAGYLEGISAGTNRYETWFGAYDPVRKAIVQEHFEKVRDSRFRKYTFDCIACKDTIDFARVEYEDPGEIEFCPPFWNLEPTGLLSQAGTIVHEVTHYFINGGTTDWGYGVEKSMDLARNKPYMAIDNADNYAFFVETSET